MRIAIDAVGIRMGGGATLLLEFLRWLPSVRPNWNWIVYVLPPEARRFEDSPRASGIDIVHVRLGDSNAGRLLWLHHELPKSLKAERVDTLFSFANIASPWPTVPQVVYIHQPLAFPPEGTPARGFLTRARMKLLRGLIIRGALASKSVVVQTQDMRNRLKEHAPLLLDRISVVPGGVPEIHGDDTVRAEKRKMIDCLCGPLLLYVAHPARHKNHGTLVRAMPLVLRRFSSATLLLTLDAASAENGAQDQKYVADLHALVAELGLGNRIVWLGNLNQGEVRYALRKCTVAVFPSLDESFGLPIAEALVERCALAASDLDYARDVAGPAASYFDPSNPDSIASSLINLISQPQLIERLKQEAEHRAPRFQSITVAEQIATLLEAARISSAARTAT